MCCNGEMIQKSNKEEVKLNENYKEIFINVIGLSAGADVVAIGSASE